MRRYKNRGGPGIERRGDLRRLAARLRAAGKRRRRQLRLLACAGAAMLLVMPAVSNASIIPIDIDFETTPSGGGPVDDTPLTGTYTTNEGVGVDIWVDSTNDRVPDFSAPNADQRAFIEQFDNNDTNGFQGTDFGTDQFDIADHGGPDPVTGPWSNYTEQLGDWFLRGQGLIAATNTVAPFIFKHTVPVGKIVTGVSGEIWDIDAYRNDASTYESWVAKAYDLVGGSYVQIGSSILSPVGLGPDEANSLDGRPWTFEFTGLNQGIDLVELTFTGTKPAGNVGLAVNNYSLTTAAVPEPSSMLLASLCLGIVIGGGLFRRYFGRQSAVCA